MPLRLPTPPTSGRSDTTTVPSRDRSPVSLLLLTEPDVAAALREVLDSAPLAVRLNQTCTLSEAMIAVVNRPPALAIVDAVLCEALEAEFLDHLLRTNTDTQVLLLHADTDEPWPRHPRLTRVMPQALLPAVAAWLRCASVLRGAVR